MLLYHGSRHRLGALEPRQAQVAEGISVPEGELQKAIYFTSDRGFAIAMAARPDGLTKIDDENHKICFENPELFSPEQEIFLYSIESDSLPGGRLEQIDQRQYAVLDIDSITPTEVEELKAGAVEQYYELTNWKREAGQGD